ncbi:MAG: FixH family protein [Giesbergeria sp.]|uniref:FixH family protein n=1 Tax=Giesbergeria sp. TaxID=2818473 RepID=UPI00261E0AF6|nr:FixH family protein [Giesbergeria sp.]MDD2609826.1 FixH family protein [Giesbergeria sp.]
MASTTLSQQPDSSPPPWWKFGYVWLILAGPIVVIFAGFYTLWLAIKTPDPVISADYYRQGIEINKTLVDKTLLPALNGRNHAATPPVDQPAPR